MSVITIYHNPRCSKSRQSLQLLKDKGMEPNIIEYLKNPLRKDELQKISNRLGLRPKDFVRKNENDFKENDLGKDIENDKKMFEAMEAYPKIIERPIVTSGSKAVIGRPPENILKLM